MKFAELLPQWARSTFSEAGMLLSFEENSMNCSQCSFVRGDVRDEKSFSETYSANLKCCTFFPDLANFSVGYALRKNQSVFEKLIEQADVGLQLGVHAPAGYKKKYSEAAFGNDETLLCPHFDNSNMNCSIWESRPSSCVGFVCKSSLKGLGQSLWAETESALHALEINLAYEAALQLGFTNYEIHATTWQASAGEKRNFYLAAADFVDSLSPSQRIDLAGDAFKVAQTNLQSLASQTAT